MTPALLAAGIILFILATFVITRIVIRRWLGVSKADQQTIKRLTETGGKARATVASARPTGVTVNNHRVQLSVDFLLEPLDGSPRFTGTKKMFLFQTQFPRNGDVWPAWYDRQDQSVFAVGAALELSADQISTYREFGIQHPLDSDHRAVTDPR